MRTIISPHDTDVLLREEDAADLLNLSVRTLQAWRLRRTGPPFVQVGRAVRYRRRDLIAWIDANTIGSNSKQAGPL
jgi:excisionase family DNA binding protein